MVNIVTYYVGHESRCQSISARRRESSRLKAEGMKDGKLGSQEAQRSKLKAESKKPGGKKLKDQDEDDHPS
jgi:hypothetical protein